MSARPIFWAFRPVSRLAPDKEKPSAVGDFAISETKTRVRRVSNTPVVSLGDLSTKQTRETPTEKYNSDGVIPQVANWILWFYWLRISLFDELESQIAASLATFDPFDISAFSIPLDLTPQLILDAR